jgi:hypothetical protein
VPANPKQPTKIHTKKDAKKKKHPMNPQTTFAALFLSSLMAFTSQTKSGAANSLTIKLFMGIISRIFDTNNRFRLMPRNSHISQGIVYLLIYDKDRYFREITGIDQ